MNEKQLLLTVQRHCTPLSMKFYAAFEILFSKRKSLIPYKTGCYINEQINLNELQIILWCSKSLKRNQHDNSLRSKRQRIK